MEDFTLKFHSKVISSCRYTILLMFMVIFPPNTPQQPLNFRMFLSGMAFDKYFTYVHPFKSRYMASMKKTAGKSDKNNRRNISEGRETQDTRHLILYDVFDDEEVYNMHERYEEESGINGNIQPGNLKRSFRNGNSGRGAAVKK